MLPHILLAGSAILLLVIDLFLPPEKKSFNQPLAILFLGISLYVTLLKLWPQPQNSSMLFGDGFSVFFILIFIFSAVLVILTSEEYLRRSQTNIGEFYALIIFATCGASLMASASDLLVLFLGLEILSISLYVLAGIQRERPKANEAAMKYFLLGAFFSGFFLYGVMLLYATTATTNIIALTSAINNAGTIFYIGLVLVLIAFSFKASLFPFHFWSPDVYDGAPTPVAAFMATGAKAAAFAALLRVFYYIFPQLDINLHSIIWLIAVLTMTIGNVLALAQANIKRMLAYSSIAHAGYLAVGFLAANTASVHAMMFYLFVYTLMNIGAFTVAYVINARGKGEYQLSDFTGVGMKNPFLAVVMAVFMFSLAGIPPTAGFFGKFYLFKSALDAGYVYLVVIAVLNSALSVFYYLRILVIMFMQKEIELPAVRWTLPVSVTLILCVLGLLNFGIFPGALLLILQYAGL
jgi:NADH-quinone oxidoreductase subunit N